MPFTKRDYEAVARIVRDERESALFYVKTNASMFDSGRAQAARTIGGKLSAMFASSNPRFDAERFAKACEPGSDK